MLIDTIYEGGTFRTLDDDRPQAHRVGVLNGRFVGFDEQLDGVRARRRVDVAGAIVYPGFNDAHHHLSLRGRRLRMLDLRPEVVKTLDDLYALVGRAASDGGDGWVRGAGYDQNALGAHPRADVLDSLANGRPVWLEHISAHMGVGNSVAFARAGHHDTRQVPDIAGGIVDRERDGRVTGLLIERAQQIVTSAFMPLSVDEVALNIATAAEDAVALGLASVTEPGIGAPDALGSSPFDLLAFQDALDQGRLPVRTTVMPYMTTLRDSSGDDGPWQSLDLGLRTGLGNDRLRIGHVKITTDGSLIGRSAFMRCCYSGSDDRGFLQYSASETTDMIVGAHIAGWDVAAHAIGDAAIDLVLDAVEEAQRRRPRPGARHRIEHFAVSSDAQVRRAAALGVIPVPQGRFVFEFGDGMKQALGGERSETCYRFRSLLDAGIEVPGSSDAPVADGSPLANIHSMVNRQTSAGDLLAPAEAISGAQAIHAYTMGSAYAGGVEQSRGSMTCGKLADLVMLSDDPALVAKEAIEGISVGATIVGDEIVHDAGAATIR